MRLWLTLAAVVALALLAPVAATHDAAFQDRAAADAAPSSAHWMGTDEYGRDIASRFLYGARWSIIIGVAATVIMLALGWILGGAAGYLGGATDTVLMWLSEVFLAVPWLYLLIAMRAALPLELAPRMAVLALLTAIAAVSWARPARLVRGMVLGLRERGYVAAARGFGVSHWRVFLHHVLPGTYGLLLAQTLVLLPRFVLAEVTLSFFGLGTSEPSPSWGSLIVPLKQVYLLREFWWRSLPVLMMVPFFAYFAFVARQAEKELRDGE